MAETQNSPTDAERSDGGRGPARSAVPTCKDMQFPSSPGGLVNLQKGDGVDNQEQGCFCSKTKRKMAALKCTTPNTRKKLRRRSGNEENDVSGIHTDRPLLSQELAQDVDSLEQPSIAVKRGQGDAITDTGQLYATESLPRISETPVGAPSTDVLEAPSYNSLVLDYGNSPHTDMNRRLPGFLASESQSSPYNVTPRNRMKSFLATFSNSQFPLDPTGGYFCAQNIEDMKLFQILRYIKSCDGGLDLLWNFIHEHADLLPLQYVNVTQDTVDQENREGEENHNLDVELCTVYGVHPAESQEGQHPRYGDEGLEVDCQGTTGVKPHIKYCYGEKNVGVLAEDRENCFVGISDNEHELQIAGVTEEISDLHGIESDCTVERSDIEENQHKEDDDSTGRSSVEGEIKEEISDLHGIESDCTVERSDIEDNQHKEDEDSTGGSSVEGEIKEEISDLHGIESDCTVERSDIEDNQHKKDEDSTGGSSVEGEIKEANSDHHGIESDCTVERSDIEDNQHKEDEDSTGGSSVEGEIKEANSDHHGIESDCTVERSDIEDIQHKEDEDSTGGSSVEGEIKEENSDHHSVDKRNGLTGSDGGAEKISELYAETEDSQEAKGDNIPVGQTSSDIVARYPLSPKADLDNDGEIYLVPGCVQGDVISHLKDHENILDTARLNTKKNETHCGEFEGEQREETGKQGCPVWQILEQLECPFNWVPDMCIKRTPGGTIQENMIDHITGKPTVMIHFVK